MKNTLVRAMMLAITVSLATASQAQLSNYSQNFEGLTLSSSTALSANGWVVYGNVFDGSNNYLYGYGTFAAPNPGGGFCALATGEGGAPQGLQYINTYSDYNNGDHANSANRILEANVFQERNIVAGDLGKTYTFKFDYKASSQFGPAGATTAAAFIKVLDPASGYATVANPTFSTTTASGSAWGTTSLTITINSAWTGHILQFGFTNTARGYQNSGVFYDNISFLNSKNVSGTVALQDWTAGTNGQGVELEFRPIGGGASTVYNVNLNGAGAYSISHSLTGTFDVFAKKSHWLKRVATGVNLTPSSATVPLLSLINGDVNNDNFVGFDDFDLLSAAFGLSLGDPGYVINADLNGDDFIGFDDFDILSANFGLNGDE